MSQPFPFSDRRYGYRCASHSQCVARGFPNNNSGESFPQQGGNIAQIVFDHQVTVSLDEPRFKDRVVDERIFPVIPQLLPNSCQMVLSGFCKNHLSCVTGAKDQSIIHAFPASHSPPRERGRPSIHSIQPCLEIGSSSRGDAIPV